MLNLHLLECTLKGYDHISDLLLAKHWVITGCKYHLCDSITSVYCKPSTPPKLSNDYMFFGATIYVPKGRLEAYESDKYWSRYTKIEEYDF